MENNALETILATLNEKQKQAVTSPSSGVLQIVAGPGTGKTKVLVARVAYLLLEEKISPQNIIVTTFTKKAANEMMERLREVLKSTDIVVGRLLIGTFHSICFKIIQKYGKKIGIEGFVIADDKDTMLILNDVFLKKMTDQDWDFVDNLPEELLTPFKARNNDSKYRGFDPKKLKRQISKLKSGGVSSEDFEAQVDKNLFLVLIYRLYQQSLTAHRLLDFDDCLLYCFKIASRFPVLNYIEHALVDEFQDTNGIQLQLMYQFAKGHPGTYQNNVTIVGDPDQSIYAFRDAQSINFEKMRQYYLQKHGLTCNIITLDENYRSSSDILDISEKIMRQQSDRTVKNLRSQMLVTMKPLRAILKSSEEEARWMAYHIEHLMKLPDLFNYSDMAVLVRSAYQTRIIETELTKRKIPYLMVRGKAFWERKEVVAMLDYMRCVANDNDQIALLRAVNFPKRGIGQKALAEIESKIEQQKFQQNGSLVFQTLKRMSSSAVSSSLGPKLKVTLGSFLLIIEESREMLEKSHKQLLNLESVDRFFTHLYTKSGLQKEFEEDVNCELNIMEIKSQLLEYQIPEDDDLPDYLGEEPVTAEAVSDSEAQGFIQKFLVSVCLYDTDPQKGESEKAKVSISTIHGAKGLEWPVVFVPGASEGLLPANFALDANNPESVHEERRCFYVATSRAKSLLFVSSYTENSEKWGRKPIEKVTRFLDKLEHMFSSKLMIESWDKLVSLYQLMQKAPPKRDQYDLTKYYKHYELCMKSFVQGDAYDLENVDLGFTLASKAPRILKAPVHKISKAPPTVRRAPSLLNVKRAPAFIPVRPTSVTSPLLPAKPSTSVKSSASSIPAGVKRAPAYIPVRAAKKRLRTK